MEYNCSMLLSISPRQEGDFLSGRGVKWGLVEADTGCVGGFDGVGEIVGVL